MKVSSCNHEAPKFDDGASQPSVAIIILNWNGLSDTMECVASLKGNAYDNYKIIVVDNNSHEDITPIVSTYPDVFLIRNTDNSGYAGGNNIGIRKADELGYEYCWVLNNDTVVDPHCLERLVTALEVRDNLAAVTNLILYHEDPSLSWFAGGIFRNGLPAIKGYFEIAEYPSQGNGTRIEETEYLSGCSFVARTSVLIDIGCFDEGYFCYVEDVAISREILKAGYNIAYVPNAVVLHKVSRSSGKHSPVKLYYKHRNMIHYLRVFGYTDAAMLRWCWTTLRFVVSLALKHRKYRSAWYLLRGLLDGARGARGRCLSL